MSNGTAGDVVRQYASTDPLKVRIQTHQLYGERQLDLNEICFDALGLRGEEALLDAGCGPGHFLAYIRERGHEGDLIGLDQSAAMVAEVATLGFRAIQADIQQLPFDDPSFDRVVARHMLYHVPDIPLALAEARRVLKPGGRLLVTTNSERSMPAITALIQDTLAAFGYDEWLRPDDRFCIENARGFFEEAGFDVNEQIIENALVFDSPEPPVAYCISCLPSLDIPQDSELRVEMERWLLAEAATRVAAMGGLWRDPTYAGVYVGTSL